MTPEEFFGKVIKTGNCWEWIGVLNKSGYGSKSIRINGRVTSLLIHRYSYELHKGPIPKGLQIRHTCENRRCCNPDHLLVGTNTDNMRDVGSEAWSKIRKAQWTRFTPKQRSTIKVKLWASYSPEQRAEISDKIAASLTGKKLSLEHREKLRLAKLGKRAKISDEARARKNASIKAAWARRKANHDI